MENEAARPQHPLGKPATLKFVAWYLVLMGIATKLLVVGDLGAGLEFGGAAGIFFALLVARADMEERRAGFHVSDDASSNTTSKPQP